MRDMETRQRSEMMNHPDDALRGARDAGAQSVAGDPHGAAASSSPGPAVPPEPPEPPEPLEPKEGCDLSIICPVCMIAMHPEHAHYRCPSCGYRDSCCF